MWRTKSPGLVWDSLSAARLLSTQYGESPEPITDFGRDRLSFYRTIVGVEVLDLHFDSPLTTRSCGCKESSLQRNSYSRTTFIAMRSWTSTRPNGRPSLSSTGISSIRHSRTSRTASRTRASWSKCSGRGVITSFAGMSRAAAPCWLMSRRRSPSVKMP